MYRTVAQIDALGALLAQAFPQHCQRFTLPEPSVQGRDVFALRVRAGSGDNRRGVLLVGGVHARELMNPDALVELAVQLVVSYRSGTDILLGGRVWAAADIKVLMETLDIYLVPCTNPDGRNHVMTVDALWRKNRRVNPGTECVGVDLNRNCDLLWGVTQGQTSCNPCTDIFAGSAAFSEPETRNVKFLLDTRRIDCFVDVHSYSELVLYPWGHATTQTTDPTKVFTTLPTGTCRPLADPAYREYMTPRDQQRFATVAQRIVTAIKDVRGRAYTPETGFGLYGTTGTHSDYVYSRHIADPSVRKTYGYTIETGPWAGTVAESFHPVDPEPVKRDTKSGLLALMQQCICAIELIGMSFLGGEQRIDALRGVRDRVLASTPSGREWILLFEHLQARVLPVVLGDDAIAGRVAAVVGQADTAVADESAPVEPQLVAATVEVLSEVARRSDDPEVRAGVAATREVLEAAAGRPVREFLERLLARGPAR
jgi:murein tripeptide amidase MpaA